jgi:hypothetical protein
MAKRIMHIFFSFGMMQRGLDERRMRAWSCCWIRSYQVFALPLSSRSYGLCQRWRRGPKDSLYIILEAVRGTVSTRVRRCDRGG